MLPLLVVDDVGERKAVWASQGAETLGLCLDRVEQMATISARVCEDDLQKENGKKRETTAMAGLVVGRFELR